MDGVLIDTESICAIAWAKSADMLGVADIEATTKGCIGLNAEDTKAYFLTKYGTDFDYETFREASSRRFYEIAERDGVAVMAGVYELMASLKEQGYRIGLASSSRMESVKKHMTQANLLQYFEVLVTGDMVTHSKPEPEIYLLACEKMGIKPEEAYAIEDSLNGVRSAYAAGMKVIMIPDLVPPTKEIGAMLTGCFESLGAFGDTYIQPPSKGMTCPVK